MFERLIQPITQAVSLYELVSDAMRELDPGALLRQIIKAKARGISPQQVATCLERDQSLTLRQVLTAIKAGLSSDQIDDASGRQPAP
jgi:hypothetical protein